MTVTILLGILVALIALLILLQLRPQDSRILDSISKNHQLIDQQLSSNRQELLASNNIHRESQAQQFQMFTDQQGQLLRVFQSQLQHLSETMEKSLHDIRYEINKRLESLQADNNEKLEKMRETVDEKLHKTLEERLGQSFKLVNDSLEKVQKGLGEMQNLASGVGDLKKVLSNVKTRGVLGEIQLGNILEQLLTPEQYAINVATIPDSQNHVEFAIKFPGKLNNDKPVWLPIDSKFPMDKYEAVQNAYDHGLSTEIETAQKELINTVKQMAKDIRSKYISPPHTTEFGVLFLPIEGLYAEVVRHPKLMQELQSQYRILVAGPTNLAAFLNSLQMGFRSLAIEKRSSEVWQILGAVKSEFGKFGEILDKTQKKLQEASNVIDKANVRTRVIHRKLKSVESNSNISSTGAIDETPPFAE